MGPDFAWKAGGILWLRMGERTSKTLSKMDEWRWDPSAGFLPTSFELHLDVLIASIKM
jgi:hypothetical protein